MKQLLCLFVFLTCFTSGCNPSIDKLAVFNVAGIYQLIWYSTRSISDYNPGGTVEALEVDEDHINLLVKGQSGKVKINYRYLNVLVSSTGIGNSGAASYSLTYKKQVIGSARVDGVSRSIVLTPTSSLRMEGLDL